MDTIELWPLKHGDHFPKPTEIACIWVTKIFDACSQKECEEFFFTDLCLPRAPVEKLTVECRILPCSETFFDTSIEPIDDGPLALVRARVCAILEIIIRDSENPSNFKVNTEEVCFLKEVILFAPDPLHMKVLVESIFEALTCTGSVDFISETRHHHHGEEDEFAVTAVIGAFIIIKTALKVQLLVPAFGYCPVPPECEELGDVCEQFLERPFPPFFPPQLSDLEKKD